MSEERALVIPDPTVLASVTEIRIPDSVDALVGSLNGLGDFLNAGGWATAAASMRGPSPGREDRGLHHK